MADVGGSEPQVYTDLQTQTASSSVLGNGALHPKPRGQRRELSPLAAKYLQFVSILMTSDR